MGSGVAARPLLVTLNDHEQLSECNDWAPILPPARDGRDNLRCASGAGLRIGHSVNWTHV